MEQYWKRCIAWFKNNKVICLSCVLAAVYFLCLLRFYIIDYYVPDFRLYSHWPLYDYTSRDGFSSLWIQICGLITVAPRQMTVLCLLLLAVSLFFMSRAAYYFLFEKSRLFYVLSVLIIYSASIWYYFYGKIFYDFPFAAALFGVLFYVVSKMYVHIQEGQNCRKDWYWICVLSGLVMSWKMYNIFAVAGLGLLFLAKDETRCYFIKEILHFKQLLLTLVLALIGYILPNYYIFIHPIKTIIGLSGFRARYDFGSFMLSITRIVWDHVTDLSFGITSFCLISAVIICFVIPALNRKWRYFGVSVFMTLCLAIFIERFSTGHCWHGFSSGLFILTFTVFILSEIEPAKVNKNLIYFALLCQILVCFTYYIPKQIYWFNTTNDAIKELETSEHDIYLDVRELADTFDGPYTVDLAVKRYTPVPTSRMHYQHIKKGEGRYIAATNFSFLNPLEATNYFAWRDLESGDQYRSNDEEKMPDCDYIIYVIPKSFMKLSDVANIHCYDEADILQSIYRENYAIYVIRC